MRRAVSNGGIAISFFCLATAGHAQTLPRQDAIVLDQVVIQGGDDSGKSGVRAKTATIGPLGRREIKDTPYSVSVIDKTLIENQQATTLPDLLKYMPSTQMEARGGGDVGRPQSRGMQGTPVFNNRLDGMNIVATTAQPIEMYERVEVVHGLAGAYFGPASPGGLFNFTRKRPTQDPYNRINTGFTGKGTWLAHGDFGGHAADGMLGYRINVLSEEGDGYVKGSDLDRSLISGAFDINLTDQTTIELNASRYRFDKFGFPGSFSYDNSVTLPDAPDPTKVGYGQKFAGYGLEDTLVGGLVKHRFNEDWSLTAGMQHQRVSRWFVSVSNALLDDDGNYSNSIDGGVSGQFRVTSNIAVLNGTLFTGGVKHDVHLGTTGVNWENYSPRSGNPSVQGYLGDASIDNPVQWDAPTGLVRNGPRYRSFSNRSQSLVLGDSITFNGQWSAILSGSYTWFDVKNYDETGTVTQKYSERGLSPSVALSYKPAENITTYVAYVDTLQSGGTAPTTAANAGQVLAPERSKQVEAGVKADLGGLDASVAVFRIERPFAFTGEDNVYRIQGDQVNKGIELELRGQLLENLNIHGGVTLLDPKLRNTGNPLTSDTDVVGAPKVQANLFMEYFFKSLPELSASANLHFTGKRAGNNINSFKVDSYATLDLGLRYERQMTKDTTAVFNLAINNVFDEHYWASIFPGSIDGATRGANSAFLGAPREVRLSASFKF
ncbi:iron complex outermembrane recepter protein [Paracoccus denitrificans]|jgi:iron complex outermembrane receptor protein|uniref:TonB-dependent siderophore receptor n=3 Tax=Paracoccaceae TaxID=31989 RepID=A1B6G8_PARDP|nr:MULTISPECIES: TonB-dependent siderophore receptor [Paracoccus]ABL71112.1 TonB-dependent siderophore receptor [Paracoccus denitrificans PD1222]SDI87964.1 iron complex outermembrane recepter protein [Paracoccus denitrificans]SFR09189.1 iron complex outermembrane recepter protein [Paracoccus denitrificans]